MNGRLEGKTALISGAGRNNGRTIALAFAREGADLILLARQRGDDLNKVASECESFNVKALPLLADVSKYAEVNRVAELGLERFGKVDVLVCAAGIRPHAPVWEYSIDEWQQVFALNVHSTFYFAKALAPNMMQRKCGNIIALGGQASLAPSRNNSAHVTSKHSLHGLIKSLALDLGPYGIRANMVCLSHIENRRLDLRHTCVMHGSSTRAPRSDGKALSKRSQTWQCFWPRTNLPT